MRTFFAYEKGRALHCSAVDMIYFLNCKNCRLPHFFEFGLLLACLIAGLEIDEQVCFVGLTSSIVGVPMVELEATSDQIVAYVRETKVHDKRCFHSRLQRQLATYKGRVETLLQA